MRKKDKLRDLFKEYVRHTKPKSPHNQMIVDYMADNILQEISEL